jgi:hypothetical protein
VDSVFEMVEKGEMEEGRRRKVLSGLRSLALRPSVGGVELICLNVPDSRKQSAPPGPRLSQLGSPTDNFGEKDRDRKRFEGATRKEERSGVL